MPSNNIFDATSSVPTQTKMGEVSDRSVLDNLPDKVDMLVEHG